MPTQPPDAHPTRTGGDPTDPPATEPQPDELEATQRAGRRVPTAPTLPDDPAPYSCRSGEVSPPPSGLPPTEASQPGSSEVRLRDPTPPRTSSAASRLHEATDAPQIEGYEILGQLGRDGQGQVYHAREKRLGLEVALKIPHRFEGAWAEMFLREARALARVNHRNVVEIKAYDVRDDVAFFTMRLVRGPNLVRIVRRAREHGRADRLSGPELCSLLGLDPHKLCPELREAMRSGRPWFRFVALWIAQAADGLGAAHEHGVLHRDVKPSNLILDEDGRVVVVDFGLARPLREQPDPAALGVTGTLPYLAPERVLGDWARVDHRADIWALGATLYELLALRRAYGRRGRDVLQQIATKDPPRPRDYVATIPPALERICRRMIERDPDRRYDDYHALAAALRAFARTGVGGSVPRRPLVLGGAAALALLAAAGGLGYALSHGSNGSPAAVVQAPGQPAPPHAEPVREPQSENRQAPRPAPGEPAAPGRALPKEPSPPGAAAAALPDVRERLVLLLVAEQDLNTRDTRPPEPDSDLAELLRAALERRLAERIDAGRVELRDAPLGDEPLRREQAVALAREQGAHVVALTRLRARPVQKITGLQYGDETVYRWKVTLACELIDVRTGRTLRNAAASDEATVAAVPIVGSQHDYRWRFDESGGEEHHTHNYRPYEPPGEFPGPSENSTARELVVRVARKLVVQIDRLGESP